MELYLLAFFIVFETVVVSMLILVRGDRVFAG